ncbi:MAG: PorT family protein [Candidatus Aminicenantes bacterium]|jgi:hypothetical protein|nr:PorT family protein [Candidatus Aminicenantes bacterium]MCJ7487228.1 PorT family protein [Candidatus Aminicenantes bacterium]TFG55001.1 MAG: PorT family protein [Candidatus Aminicenantes bacterium]
MKKGIFFAIVLLFAALIPRPLAAAVDIDLGFKGGLSLSNVRWSDDDGSEKSARATFGVFVAFNLNKNFAIQPEINFLSTGEQWTDTMDTGEYKLVEFFNYLHIPVLIKYRFAQQGKVIPVIFAGPALGILLSAREKEYVDGTLDLDISRKEFFKSTDFGADFGVGAEMMMNKCKIILDLRYYLGLSNSYIGPPGPTMKNQALMFTAGIGF